MMVNSSLWKSDDRRQQAGSLRKGWNLGIIALQKSALAIVLLASLGHVAFAQTATISGTVTDQSGSAIAGVTVTATQTATAQTRTAATDKSGTYVISLLPIGVYEVTATQTGFKTDLRKVELRVGDRSSVDFNLALGDVAQQIEVKGGSLVQAESSSVGAVVENKRIEEVPLNGRQFQNLALLVPGVSESAQGSSLGFRGGINVAGTRAEMTGFTLDGVDIVENLVKALSFKPSVDMIDQFRVDTSTYSAEYGRAAGGQIRATTKAGTNNLHGTLFEFVRNSAFDAKNFFDSPTAPIPGFRRNNFGGTIGGPIVKNRTFFFGDYEGLISRQAQTRTATVPTVANLNGDFSGATKLVIDPLTGQPFPGNVIPADRISPVSKNIIQQYPQPDLPGNSVRNYVSSPTDVRNIHQFTVRLDHRISDNNNIYGRYSFNNDFELDPFDVFSGISNLPFYGRDDYQRAQSAAISDTHIFGPTLVGQITLGYNRFKQIRTNVSHDNYPQIWGIQGTTTNLNAESGGVPAVNVTGYDALGKSNLPSDRVDTTYQVIPSLTYIHGTHTFKFGGDASHYSTMRLNNGGGLGSYTFSGQYSGNSIADLLLGFPSKASRSLGDTRNPMFSMAYAAYAQDDWKITRSLTLNLGVRYDLQSPLWSADDRLVSFNPATGTILLAGNPSTRRDIGSLINPSSPGYNASLAQLARNIPIVNLGTRNTYTFDKHNIAPRLGLAYRLFGSDRVVLRTGYGIFYNELLGQYGQTGWNTFPYFITQTFNGNPTSPNLTIANPFPAASAAATISPAGIMSHYKTGYVQNYNFGIQASPYRDVVIDIGYAGSVSTHLPATTNLNQPSPSPTGSVASRRPYPQFGNISFLDSSASANFNSLQVLIEKRYSRGLELAASYTYSRSLDTVGDGSGDASSPPYALNVRGTMYGPSSFNETQRLVLSYVYELPFGPGKRYFGSTNRAAKLLASGWELSGIGTFETGRPFTLLISQDRNNTGGSNITRPILIGNPNQIVGGQTVDHWFNTGAYALPVFGFDGNVGRNTLLGPGFNNIDFSLIKNTSIREGKSIQFRAEIFNLLNHPNFDLPNNTIDSAQAGGIFTAEASRQIQLGLKFVF